MELAISKRYRPLSAQHCTPLEKSVVESTTSTSYLEKAIKSGAHLCRGENTEAMTLNFASLVKTFSQPDVE